MSGKNKTTQVFRDGKTTIKIEFTLLRGLGSEEHSMDQYRSRLKLSENFERHWSIQIPGEIHMDQSLVHTFAWGNSYGPMVMKVPLKFPSTLALVHGWLFPVGPWGKRGKSSQNAFIFWGNATTIKFWKCKFYCREILLSMTFAQAPNCKLFGLEFPWTLLTPTAGPTGKHTLWCGPQWFSARTSVNNFVQKAACADSLDAMIRKEKGT